MRCESSETEISWNWKLCKHEKRSSIMSKSRETIFCLSKYLSELVVSVVVLAVAGARQETRSISFCKTTNARQKLYAPGLLEPTFAQILRRRLIVANKDSAARSRAMQLMENPANRRFSKWINRRALFTTKSAICKIILLSNCDMNLYTAFFGKIILKF